MVLSCLFEIETLESCVRAVLVVSTKMAVTAVPRFRSRSPGLVSADPRRPGALEARKKISRMISFCCSFLNVEIKTTKGSLQRYRGLSIPCLSPVSRIYFLFQRWKQADTVPLQALGQQKTPK